MATAPLTTVLLSRGLRTTGHRLDLEVVVRRLYHLEVVAQVATGGPWSSITAKPTVTRRRTADVFEDMIESVGALKSAYGET